MKRQTPRKRSFVMINQPKVLVVEDESIIAMDIQYTLQRFGCDVCGVVSSGEESIESVSRTNPDLILMDIKLRGEMNGIYAAKQIQSKFNIPVIYLTAYGDENTLSQVDRTKPFGYIHKPFEETELQTEIVNLLDQGRKCQFN
jgi:CheY-like chemotaxis protein